MKYIATTEYHSYYKLKKKLRMSVVRLQTIPVFRFL